MNNIVYKATKTSIRFHKSEKMVVCLMGAVGSGKSVACANHCMMKAFSQGKSEDGIRYSRIVIVRNTYPELKMTTLSTWLQWFPEEIYGRVSRISPFFQHIKVGDINCEVYFLALDKEKDVKKLLSLECNIIWFNEAREVPYQVVARATERVGRYNRCENPKENIRQVILDTNPTNTTHWIYKIFEVNRPEGYEIFHQEPGLIKNEKGEWIVNKNSDNYENLKKLNLENYYLDISRGKSDEEIRMYCCGEYTSFFEGEKVYKNYNDNLHYAKDIQPVDSDIILGFDFGLTPACVVTQITSEGVVLVLEEIVCEDFTIDVRSFIKDFVIRALKKYENKKITGYGDPSGSFRKDTDASTCINICNNELDALGIKIFPASSNSIKARIDSVNFFLSKLTNGNPSFLISKNCPKLREGFLGGYRYKSIRTSNGLVLKEVPEKNEYSHPHDALQYACLNYISAYTVKNKNKIDFSLIERTRGFSSNVSWM